VAEERVGARTDQLLGQAGRLSHEVEVEADGGVPAAHGVPHVECWQDVEARQVRDRLVVVEAGTEGDEGAPVVPSQREALVAERTGERDDVCRHRALGVGGTGRVRGLVARAVAAQVGTDHGVVIRQVRCDVPPHQVRLREAVQKHDRIARSANGRVQRDAVGDGDALGVEAGDDHGSRLCVREWMPRAKPDRMSIGDRAAMKPQGSGGRAAPICGPPCSGQARRSRRNPRSRRQLGIPNF
jgi:hypothetical protein